ncbi:MAG: hypothetical protein QM651_17900, partial [Rhodoblastus sp.]
MSNLDVSLTLKLVNLFSSSAKDALRDLQGLKSAAESIGKSGTGSSGASALDHEVKKIDENARKAVTSLRGIANASFGATLSATAALSANVKKIDTNFQSAAASAGAAKRNIDDVGKTISAQPAAIEAAGKSFILYAKKAKTAEEQVEALQKRVQALAAGAFTGKQIEELARKLRAPLETAMEKAEEFEAKIFSIANAAGALGNRKQLADSVLEAAKKSNLPWEDIAKGERKMAELGGGAYQGELAQKDRRTDLARLAKVAEASPEDIYQLYFEHRKLGLDPDKSIRALYRDYATGKQGAYELKNMAQGLPQLQQAGRTFGMTPEQAATSIPTMLQMFRESSGKTEAADTWMKHILGKLDDPHYKKRFRDELNVDVDAERTAAQRAGKDPLLAVLDKLSAALTKQVDAAGAAAGAPNKETEQVEGVDPSKMGEVARDYYFRMGLTAYARKRGEYEKYLEGTDTAYPDAMKAWDEQRATTRGTHEAKDIAQSEAAIRSGDTQMMAQRRTNEMKRRAANVGTNVSQNLPTLTGLGMGAWNLGTTLAGAGGALYSYGSSALAAYGGWQIAKLQYPWLGQIGSSVGGAVKGVAEAPKIFGGEMSTAMGEVAAQSPKVALFMQRFAAFARFLGPLAMILGSVEAGKGGLVDLKELSRRNRGGRDLTPEETAAELAKLDAARAKALGRANASPMPNPTEADAKAMGAVARVKEAAKTDLQPEGAQAMQTYAKGLESQGAGAVAKASSIVEQLKSVLNTTFTPTISPRVTAPSPASGGGATPGKQSRLRGG